MLQRAQAAARSVNNARMTYKDLALLRAASQAARRFQLMASFHGERPNNRALGRDGQAVFDLLWRMGFRPGGGIRDKGG